MADERSEDHFGALIGILFWVVVIGVAFFAYFKSDNADIFLNVKTADTPTVSGAVLFGGAIVKEGKVHLVLMDPKNRGYIGSHVLPIDEKTGNFDAKVAELFGSEPFKKPLMITATFQGAYYEGKDPAKLERKPLKGESTIYINSSPPLDRKIFWTAVAVAVFLTVLLIALFTGSLTTRKARVLFSVTYLMTFLSLAVPIAFALIFSRNEYILEMMYEAPIGVMKGTAKNVREPQWLVNVGGAVIRPEAGIKAAKEKIDVAGKPVEEGAPEAAKAPKAPNPTQPVVQESLLGQLSTEIKGGLVVPFYVVFLAMLGAGINMTRMVPEIQKKYAAQSSRYIGSPFNWRTFFWQLFTFGGEAAKEEDADIRLQVIKNYMYLLSAPFLAIAVYYLLQIVAESVTEPVLVVISFATGMISDTIVDGIIKYSRRMVDKGNGGGDQKGQPREETPETQEKPGGAEDK